MNPLEEVNKKEKIKILYNESLNYSQTKENYKDFISVKYEK